MSPAEPCIAAHLQCFDGLRRCKAGNRFVECGVLDLFGDIAKDEQLRKVVESESYSNGIRKLVYEIVR